MAVYRLLPTNAALQTNDGDMTFVSFAQDVPQDFTFATPRGVVPEADIIEKITVVWIAKDPDASADVGKAGILSGGLRQHGASQIFDAGGYMTSQDDFLTDASDGQPWTITKLVLAQLTGLFTLVTGTQPRITMMAVDVTTRSGRGLSATGDDLTNTASSAATGDLTATPSSLSLQGTPASLADGATVTVQDGRKADLS